MLSGEQWVALVSLTRAALDLEQGGDPHQFVWPDVGDDALVEAIRRHRVESVIAPWLPSLGAAEDTARGLHERAVGIAATALRQAKYAGAVVARLNDAGIRCMVVKGQALAAQTRGDVAARGTGDLDLFVSPCDVTAALRALAGLGQRCGPAVPVPGTAMWDVLHWSLKEIQLGDPEGRRIDLHWRLDERPDLVPTFAEAWERREFVDLGCSVPTLCPRHALAHSCAHAEGDDWGWIRSLIDIHRLMEHRDAWDAEPLSPFERRTVAVARLVDPQSPSVLARRSSTVRAGRAQRSNPPSAADVRPTGAGMLLRVRAALRGSRSIDGLLRTAIASVLGPGSAGAVDDVSPIRAYPKAIRRLVVWKRQQVRGRRSVHTAVERVGQRTHD